MSIENLEALGNNLLGVVKGRMRLFKLELALAKSSVIPFLILAFALCIITAVTWLSLLTLIGYELFLQTQSILIGLLSIFLVNLVMGILLFCFLGQYLKQMQFTRTRKHFKKINQDSHYAN